MDEKSTPIKNRQRKSVRPHNYFTDWKRISDENRTTCQPTFTPVDVRHLFCWLCQNGTLLGRRMWWDLWTSGLRRPSESSGQPAVLSADQPTVRPASLRWIDTAAQPWLHSLIGRIGCVWRKCIVAGWFQFRTWRIRHSLGIFSYHERIFTSYSRFARKNRRHHSSHE